MIPLVRPTEAMKEQARLFIMETGRAGCDRAVYEG